MHYFYSNEISGGTITFSSAEARHLTKSLRVRDGDVVNVLDGVGGKYKAEVIITVKKIAAKVLDSEVQQKPPDRLHLVIAPTKSPSRFEWMIEKATELGVDIITPIVTSRSERTRIKLDRLQKIAIGALKQSGNLFLPQVNPIVNMKEAINPLRKSDHKFIAHCQTDGLEHLAKYLPKAHLTTVLIGPEGDFTLEEIALAKNIGFIEVSLGNLRLRTETAGLYVSTLHSILNNIK